MGPFSSVSRFLGFDEVEAAFQQDAVPFLLKLQAAISTCMNKVTLNLLSGPNKLLTATR